MSNKNQEEKLKREIGARIKEIRMMSSLKNQKSFCEKLGIGQAQLSNIEKGKWHDFSSTVLLLLLFIRKDSKRINMDWLITGKGAMLISDLSDEQSLNMEIYNKIILSDAGKKEAILKLLT